MPHLRYILPVMEEAKYTREKLEAALTLAAEGRTWVKISEAFGCTYVTLYRYMQEDAILRALFVRARAAGQEIRADQVNSLVDDNQALPEDQRLPADLLKIKADAMKWWLGVMQPNRFGQRQTIAVERVDVQGAIQEARERVSRRSDTVELPITSKVLSLGNAGLDYEHLFS